jgi:hypothetical protein
MWQGADPLWALKLDCLHVTQTTFQLEWFHPHDLQDRFTAVGLQATVTYEQTPERVLERSDIWAVKPSVTAVARYLSNAERVQLGSYRLRRGGLDKRFVKWRQVEDYIYEYRHVVCGHFPLTAEVAAFLSSLPSFVREVYPCKPPACTLFMPLLTYLAPWFVQDPRWGLTIHPFFATLHSPPLQGDRLVDAQLALVDVPDLIWKRVRVADAATHTYCWWVPPELENIAQHIVSYTYEHPAHDRWLFANARLREVSGWVCVHTVATPHAFSASVISNADRERFTTYHALLHLKY